MTKEVYPPFGVSEGKWGDSVELNRQIMTPPHLWCFVATVGTLLSDFGITMFWRLWCFSSRLWCLSTTLITHISVSCWQPIVVGIQVCMKRNSGGGVFKVCGFVRTLVWTSNHDYLDVWWRLGGQARYKQQQQLGLLQQIELIRFTHFLPSIPASPQLNINCS